MFTPAKPQEEQSPRYKKTFRPTNAESTVVPQLNQGVPPNRAVYRLGAPFFLSFLGEQKRKKNKITFSFLK